MNALKYQKLVLFKLSLIVFLFLLPVMAYGLYGLIAEGSIIIAYAEDAEKQWLELVAFRRLSYLSLIAFSVLYSLAATGAARVYRRYSYNEGYILKDDFLEGLKDNWKPNLATGLAYGTAAYGLYFLISLVSSGEAVFLHYGLLIVYFVLLGLLFVSLTYMIFLRDIYKNTVPGYFKAAAGLLFKYLPYSLLAALMGIWPFALFYLFAGAIPSGICIIAVLVLDFLYAFFNSLAGISNFLLFAYMADESVNKNGFPSQYRKGLYREGQNE